MKLFDRLWNLFTSTKLTVVLLLVLAGTAVIGTLIQQGQPPAEYIKRYGEAGFHLFAALGFFDLYHSWWFQGLLLALCLNLIACAWEKLPLELRAARRTRGPLALSQLRSYPLKEEVGGRVDDERVRQAFSLFTRRVEAFESPEGKFLHAERGRYARLAPHIVHIGLLVIFSGALIGSFYGFRGTINILEGESADKALVQGGGVTEFGFEVQCRKFTVEFYPGTQRPKKFASHLTIVDQGRAAADKVIEVNSPLTYKGLTFYQASYGPAGEPTFTVDLVDLASGKRTTYTTNLREEVTIPGNSGSFSIVDFTPSYALDMPGSGHKDLGPTALIAFSERGKMVKSFPIFQNYPDFEPGRGGKYNVVLKGFREAQNYYTGLQVTKDPGARIVWLGCGIMFIGLFQALFSSRRRAWAFIPKDAGAPVLLAGKADKDRFGFQREFQGIVDRIRKAPFPETEQSKALHPCASKNGHPPSPGGGSFKG